MSGEAHFPGQAPIEAYGNGGFRFAGMSHRGSLLCLPSGVFAWPVSRIGDLTPSDFSRVFDEPARVSFVLLGAGPALVRPSQDCAPSLRGRGHRPRRHGYRRRLPHL